MIKAISNLTNSTMHSFNTPLRSANADRSTHTQTSRFGRLRCALHRSNIQILRTLIVGILLLSRSVAWAANYVFMYNNYFVAQSTTPTTSFVPNTSIYSGTSGSTFRNGNNYYIRYNNGLQFSTTNYTNLTLDGNYLAYVESGWWNDTYYYLNMQNPDKNNRAWRMSNTTSYRATAYVVTTKVIKELSNYTISGYNTLTGTGAFSYTHSNSYYSNYTKYSWTDHTYYSTNPAQAASTTAPAATEVTTGYTWTLEGGGTNASVNASSGQITVSSLPATDLEMTLTCSVTSNGITKTASMTVVLQGTTIAAPTISNSNNYISLSTASIGATIYYTTDGSTPSSSNGTTYTVPFNIEGLTFPVTIKAIATRGGKSSTVSTQTYNQPKCATPVISISATGAVTITCATEGATIRYIKGDNPDDPTGNTGTQGTSTTLTNMQFIKAIATKTGYENSEVATDQYITSGINNGTIVLNDKEDHNWAYYSDNNSPIHCLNPADITIKYYGYGTKTMTSSNTDQLPANSAFDQNVANTAVKVNKNEAGHTFIYYKTLENAQEDGTGNYPYTIIPNPFQVRPTYGTDNGRWRGFYAWRVKSLSNGLSIKVGNTTYNSNNISSGIIIYAEQEVEFITSNPKGNTVEFEALWAKAYLDDGNNHYSNSGNYRNAYERNFKKVTSLSTYNYPVTISSINPDGSGTVGTVSGPNRNNYTCSQDVKLENMTLGMGNYYIDGNSYNLTIGRGVANGNNNVASAVYGDYSGSSVRSNFTLRIEGGRYSNVRVFYNGSRANCSDAFTGHVYFGSDYDRANNETNNKLVVSSRVGLSQELAFTNAASITEVFVMSGTFGTNTADVEFYMGYQNATSGASQAKRSIRIYGGDFLGGLAGGIEGGELDANTVYLTMRISGGTIHRYLYGSGQFSPAYGTRQIVITGGTFDSWVSGGCYGTNNKEGNTEGNTDLYFGGYANQTNTEGIFGAGYGNYTTGNDKYTVHNSTVVFADEANTAGSVYGGGNNGYAKEDINVYIAGGTISGNVFGGANKAPSKADIAVTVTSGTVNGGVYGGSNQSGDISGNITVDVYGTDFQPNNGYAINQVFGGGNVANYSKTPTVTVHCGDNISIGELYGGGNQATVAGTNVTVSGGNRIGYVYGGGRQATVNGNSTVSIKGGTIENIFGGNNIDGAISGNITVTLNEDSQDCGLNAGNVFGAGNLATYTGSPQVSILNGLVSGNVFGGGKGQLVDGNQRGTKGQVTGSPQITIGDNDNSHSVTILGDVYGGGDAADVSGTPVIIVNDHSTAQSGSHNCSTNIGYLYGGGNAADVGGTNITINGGRINTAYGGGHGDKDALNPSKYADVKGNVVFNIKGGIFNQIFAGSNSKGTITGNTVALTIGKQGDCPMIIGEVYGGGNEAAGNAGTINIGCTGTLTEAHNNANDTDNRIGYELEGIGTVYGGANAANINSDITLNINSGIVKKVFGGNNSDGSINGTITVNIEKTDDCSWYVGTVYGGGNIASYSTPNGKSNYPQVNIKKGAISGSVYGGGLGETARVTGNPQVTVTGGAITGNIYGGGEAAPVTGNPVLTLSGNNTSAADIYGGGKGTTAVVTGNSSVTVSSGTYSNVFGGGEAANLSGSVTVNIQGGTISNDVYGGGALAHTNTANQNGNAITPKTNTTTVNLTGGTMKNVYGGGLGNSTTEAKVYGDVFVNLNKGVSSNNRGAAVTDYLFGCNNVNGTPLGSVTVYVQGTQNSGLSTMLAKNNSSYDMKAIYGGGNLAAYIPAADTSSTHVILKGCRTISSEYVYGGGNAAPVPATDVKVYGTYKVSSIFGGGNGKDALPNGDENPGADVGIYKVTEAVYNATAEHLQYKDPGHEKGDDKYILYGNIAGSSIIGTTNVMFLGGNVDHLFGGSNTKGDIIKQANVILGDEDLQTCDFHVNDVYGGSNEAYMSGSAAIDMNCIEGMNEIYGGSRMADVNNNVVLTITGGTYGKVFGGNNISGRIFGSITVNIEQTGCLPIVIDELYGGGNQAPYSVYGYTGNTLNESGDKWADPTINIISCESINKVFGGGLGSPAIVIGDPHININMVKGWTNGDYKGNGEIDDPHAAYKLTKKVSDNVGVIGTVFGGGNEAIVKGQTTINIGTEQTVTVKNVSKAVYNAIKNTVTGIANPGFAQNDGDAVTKDLTIQVEGANITGNVYGGGNNANVTGGTNIQVGKNQ